MQSASVPGTSHTEGAPTPASPPPDSSTPGPFPAAPDPPAEQAPGADVQPLGVLGAVRFGLAVGQPLDQLPVDSLVVPMGPSGVGSFGSAVMRETGIDVALLLPPDAVVTADEPLAARVAPDASGARPRLVVFATSRDASPAHSGGVTPGGTVDGAGRAAAACVRVAAAAGSPSLGMPLIGSGTSGQDPAAVAESVMAGTRSAVRDLGPDTRLRRVVFVVEDHGSADRVRAAWQGYRSQPFANDRPAGPDLLNVRDEVEALADMLLLRDVQPPLAVGVLGGWGSGKSFVMHLMRERLDEVRASALAEHECWDGDRVSPFVGHVYPIEFNAWTYARADLWAALMQTTLSELDRQLGIERRLIAAGKDLRDGAEWRRLLALPEELHRLYEQTPDAAAGEDLFKTLSLVHAEERAELERKESTLQSLRDEAARVEADVEAKVEAAVEADLSVDMARWAPLRNAVARTVGSAGNDVKEWLVKEAPETEGILHGASVTARDARKVAAALRTVRPPDNAVARSVIARHWVAALVFLALSVLAPLLLVRLRESLGDLTLSAGAAAVVAWAGSAVRLVSGWTSIVRRFAERLAVWQEAVEEDVRRVEATRDERIAEEKRTSEDLAKVREKIDRAENDVERLRQRVGLVSEFRSVSDLVRERLESGTYEQRLGVMQQISEDLASISRSMAAPQRDVAQGPRRALFPRGPARVVLFIDDLDRCPPAKVVEVLEAVQLLLSTDLFVVVVAIDVRYVTKALEKVYEGVLDADGEPSGIDYLEKIIQIPYRTRALTPTGARRFLEGQMRIAAGDVDDYPDAAGEQVLTGPGDDSLRATGWDGTTEAIARDLDFTREEVDVLSTCCAVLALSPRAGKRVANVAKLFRMVWARRGRGAPSLDETAAVALLVALSAAHPEVQRDALAHLDGVRGEAALTLGGALLGLPKPGKTASERVRAQHEAWRAAVEAATETPVPPDTGRVPFRVGAAPVSDVRHAVDFVAAFCFVAGTSSLD